MLPHPGSAGFDSTRKREGALAILRNRLGRTIRRIGRWERVAFRVYAVLVALIVVAYLVIDRLG